MPIHWKSERKERKKGIRSISLTSVHRIDLEQSAVPGKQQERAETNIDLPRTNQSK